jgi:hypothetical protein
MNMNNTKTVAIVAVLTAATLVLGGTLAATTTSAFAYLEKGAHDNGKDNGKANDNTDPDIPRKCNQIESGFDQTLGDQNCDGDILSNSKIFNAQ